MPKKRYTPEEIVAKLRQVDVLVSQGQNIADAIRQIGVSEVTYYRWRQEYGGLKRGMNQLLHGRDIRQVAEPVHGRNGKKPDFFVFSELNEVRKQVRDKWQMAAEQIGHHRRAALVGHTVQHNAGFVLQELIRDMTHRADTDLSDGELTRLGLGRIDHRLQTCERPIHASDKGRWRLADQHDRHEVTCGITRQAREHQFVESHLSLRGKQQVAAIRHRLCHCGGSKVAACTGAVFYDERLASSSLRA